MAELQFDRLLICEGFDERAIAQKMQAEGLTPPMDIQAIGSEGTGWGNTGLQNHLEAISGVTIFQNIRHVGIFVDSDDSQVDAFNSIKEQINEANNYPDINGRFPVPIDPFVREDGAIISILVILSPGDGRPGCLETLLLRVLYKLYPDEMRCVDALIDCAGLDTPEKAWSLSKIDKAKVRSAIATIHNRSPALPLSLLWQQAPDLIPVTDDAFNDLSANLGNI